MHEKKTEISVKAKANIFWTQMILKSFTSPSRQFYKLLVKGHWLEHRILKWLSQLPWALGMTLSWRDRIRTIFFLLLLFLCFCFFCFLAEEMIFSKYEQFGVRQTRVFVSNYEWGGEEYRRWGKTSHPPDNFYQQDFITSYRASK